MPKWNGALLWRGLAEGAPVFDGRTMVWAGHPLQKFVMYPLLDLPDRRQQLNFIAELRTDETELLEREDWNQPGDLADFLPQFEGWKFPWLDVPALIASAPEHSSFRWSIAIPSIAGRLARSRCSVMPLTRCIRSDPTVRRRPSSTPERSPVVSSSYEGDIEHALQRYDEVRRPATSAIVLANRGLGPELPMQLVEQRAPSGFAQLSEVITPDEILEVTDGYRKMAGFSLQQLHDRPSLAEIAVLERAAQGQQAAVSVRSANT